MADEEPDMELPWVLDPERRGQAGARPRLDNENLFLLALREAFADGDVSTVENQLLGKFAKALKIDGEKAKKMAALARSEHRKGKIQGEGEADLEKVFRKACAFAAVDGEIDAGERALLESFGRGVGITGEALEKVLEDCLAGGEEAPAEPAEPPGETPPAPAPAEAKADDDDDEYKVKVDVELPDLDIKFSGF